MTVRTGKPREFTGWHMLASVVSFFAVVVAVNLTLAYFANATWSGLVVPNGYVASQSFNADEAAAKAQEARGWQVAVSHSATALTLSFADRQAQPITGLSLAGALRRSVTMRDDQSLSFAEQPAGTYTATATLASGLWELEVNGSGSSGGYRKTFRFVVK